MTFATAAPAVTAAFLASLVEVVEAFTIVLAVATLRGWRPAALGTTTGLTVLTAIVLLLGPLLDRVPITSLQLAIGILLLLFGMGWLRKASLRAAGIVPLHDEDAIFAAEAAELGDQARRQQRNLDWVAGVTALKGCCSKASKSYSSSSPWVRGEGYWCLPASVRSPPALWFSPLARPSTGRCRACRRIRSSLALALCCRPLGCSGRARGSGSLGPGKIWRCSCSPPCSSARV